MSDEREVAGQVVDLLEDYADEALGAMLGEKVLDHFPYVKTVAAGANVLRSAQDWLLRRKVRQFLAPVDRLSKAQRTEMVGRLREDERFRLHAGVQLIEILDRMKSHRKPRAVGEALVALGERKIDLRTLLRLLAAIERLPVHEIGTVRRFVEAQSNPPARQAIERESIQALLLAGLVEITIGSPRGGPFIYGHTPAAAAFVELNLDRAPDDKPRV